MATLVNVNEAKTNLSHLLERVQQGEEFVLAKAGKPYARLVPMEKREPRQPGIAKGSVDESFFDLLPEEELRECKA